MKLPLTITDKFNLKYIYFSFTVIPKYTELAWTGAL
jgi:hypothetical protein